MIIGLQLVAIVFALVMIYFAYLNYSRGELSRLEIVVWYNVWAVTIVIVIFPQLLSTFAQTFSISRVFDLLVVGGFILVISMVYKTYVTTKRLEKKLEDYVRIEALKKVKYGKKNK